MTLLVQRAIDKTISPTSPREMHPAALEEHCCDYLVFLAT